MMIEGLREIHADGEWADILNHCIDKNLDIYEAQSMLVDAGLEEYAQI